MLPLKSLRKEGWNVIATMRKPDDSLEKELPKQIKVVALDVTKPQTIRNAIDEGIKHFGTINAIINNAGYGFGAILRLHP